MTVKITQRIKGFKVVDETLERPAVTPDTTTRVNVVEMDESIQRPETLVGMTYKIKSPLFEHALYVTVNDVVLNAGTPHRAAPTLRDLHQLEEHGSLPVDRRAHPDHVCRVPQGG